MFTDEKPHESVYFFYKKIKIFINDIVQAVSK